MHLVAILDPELVKDSRQVQAGKYNPVRPLRVFRNRVTVVFFV